MNATNSTNPATLLGFGTWVSFGAGRVPVGINPSDTDFDTAEETGGAKNHTLTLSQIPSHSHTISGNISRSGFSFEHHQFNSRMPGENYDTNPTVSNAGGGQGHNNLQPYIVVYMWKRTA
jgi:microcystin-dependent protein